MRQLLIFLALSACGTGFKTPAGVGSSTEAVSDTGPVLLQTIPIPNNPGPTQTTGSQTTSLGSTTTGGTFTGGTPTGGTFTGGTSTTSTATGGTTGGATPTTSVSTNLTDTVDTAFVYVQPDPVDLYGYLLLSGYYDDGDDEFRGIMEEFWIEINSANQQEILCYWHWPDVEDLRDVNTNLQPITNENCDDCEFVMEVYANNGFDADPADLFTGGTPNPGTACENSMFAGQLQVERTASWGWSFNYQGYGDMPVYYSTVTQSWNLEPYGFTSVWDDPGDDAFFYGLKDVQLGLPAYSVF